MSPSLNSLPSVRSTPEKSLISFISRLACLHTSEQKKPLAPYASSLPCFFSSSPTSAGSCVIPSLSLRQTTHPLPKSKVKSCQKALAAQRLSTPITLRKDNIASAPSTILGNVSSVFQWMLNERLQATTQALSYHSLVAKNATTDKVEKMTFNLSGNALSVVASSAKFRSPYPHKASDQKAAGAKIVSPLTFEGVFKVLIMGKYKVNVHVKAPGTVSACFSSSNLLRLEKLEIKLDTVALLDRMLRHCRDVVRKAWYLVAAQVSKAAKENERSPLPDRTHSEENLISSRTRTPGLDPVGSGHERPNTTRKNRKKRKLDIAYANGGNKRRRMGSLSGKRDSLALPVPTCTQ